MLRKILPIDLHDLQSKVKVNGYIVPAADEKFIEEKVLSKLSYPRGGIAQLTGEVTVTVLAKAIVDKVCYVLGSMKERLPFITNTDGSVGFKVTHFSVYALVYKVVE